MHRTVVNTKDVEKITWLPEDLKKFETLELLITPAHPDKNDTGGGKQKHENSVSEKRCAVSPFPVDYTGEYCCQEGCQGTDRIQQAGISTQAL